MATITTAEIGIPGPSGPPSLSAGALVTTAGDLIRGAVGGTAERLPIGTNRQVLGISGGLPAWLSGVGVTLRVASNDAPAWAKALADYVCDGVADDVEINAALVALGADGGTVQLSQGAFYITSSVIMRDYQTLAGMGFASTVLFLQSGANVPVIQTVDWATLTGGNTTGGPSFWAVRDLEIDGNVTNQPTSPRTGYGLRIYARNFELRRIVIHHCNTEGVLSEWSTSEVPPAPHSMEARITDVEVHDCARDGILWAGPHDSVFAGCVIWANGTADVVGATYGVHVYSSAANACEFHGCNVWGASHDWCYVIDAGNVQINGGKAAGAAVGQVYVNGNDFQLSGTLIYGASVVGTNGITIAGTAARYDLRCKIQNAPGSAINFDSDGGSGWIEALIHHPSGAAAIGAPHATSVRRLKVTGGGSGSIDTFGT